MKKLLSVLVVTLLLCVNIPGVAGAATYPKTFTDVSENNAYYDVIHKMANKGIINGYNDGTFKPNDNINRKQAAALINRVVDLKKTKNFKEPSDLSKNNAYYNDLKKLIEADVISVDSKNNINPNAELTRGEMAKILSIAFDLNMSGRNPFKDAPNGYSKYVVGIYNAEITTGYQDGTFGYTKPLTRAHYSVFMNRAMEYRDKTKRTTSVGLDPSSIDIQNITAAQFLDLVKDNPYFMTSNSKKLPEITFKNKDFVRFLANSEKEFKNSFPDLIVTQISPFFTLHDFSRNSDLRKNGKYNGGVLHVSYSGEKEVSIMYDFTDEMSVEAASKALKMFDNENQDISKLFIERTEYIKDHYYKYPNKMQESLNKAYKDIEGYDLVQIGSLGIYEGMTIRIYKK